VKEKESELEERWASSKDEEEKEEGKGNERETKF